MNPFVGSLTLVIAELVDLTMTELVFITTMKAIVNAHHLRYEMITVIVNIGEKQWSRTIPRRRGFTDRSLEPLAFASHVS
jgi:hypothetical protein